MRHARYIRPQQVSKKVASWKSGFIWLHRLKCIVSLLHVHHHDYRHYYKTDFKFISCNGRRDASFTCIHWIESYHGVKLHLLHRTSPNFGGVQPTWKSDLISRHAYGGEMPAGKVKCTWMHVDCLPCYIRPKTKICIICISRFEKLQIKSKLVFLLTLLAFFSDTTRSIVDFTLHQISINPIAVYSNSFNKNPSHPLSPQWARKRNFVSREYKQSRILLWWGEEEDDAVAWFGFGRSSFKLNPAFKSNFLCQSKICVDFVYLWQAGVGQVTK